MNKLNEEAKKLLEINDKFGQNMTSSAVKTGLPISDKKKGKGGFDLSKKGTLGA